MGEQQSEEFDFEDLDRTSGGEPGKKDEETEVSEGEPIKDLPANYYKTGSEDTKGVNPVDFPGI